MKLKKAKKSKALLSLQVSPKERIVGLLLQISCNLLKVQEIIPMFWTTVLIILNFLVLTSMVRGIEGKII